MSEVTKEYALTKLQRAIQALESLRQMPYDSPEFRKWKNYTCASVERIFGKASVNSHSFLSIRYTPSIFRPGGKEMTQGDSQKAYIQGIDTAKSMLESMVDEIREYWDDETTNSVPVFLPEELGGFWQLIHPAIIAVSRSRFETGHFADSVEAAFKEINSIIKSKVRDATGTEYDGANLMNRAFSIQNAVIRLDDLTTDTGKSIQQGYMQLYAGSMTGIRNPKAHSNISIDKTRAIHFLFLASLLMYKLEEAL